ncbi:hypothetical protein BDV95DRAFT_610907 [Massariosphaeria phaeospora]|uniref:RING-type domain-containing protein n=1 Tax=Massariosphaeria phaeospora TaxID=100035 RepID=A0A7C8M1X5_9PLEO|nr:hypothetical protein BDV95DRAFT_610907 [Massariosphaeria phaeospora]
MAGKYAPFTNILDKTNRRYLYKAVPTPSDDDECFICLRKFGTRDSPDDYEPPCEPIKLVGCGHIVGKQCFEQYRRRTSDVDLCLTCRQNLATVEVPPSQTRYCQVLRWVGQCARLHESDTVQPKNRLFLALLKGSQLTGWEMLACMFDMLGFQILGPVITLTLAVLCLALSEIAKLYVEPVTIAVMGSPLAQELATLIQFVVGNLQVTYPFYGPSLQKPGYGVWLLVAGLNVFCFVVWTEVARLCWLFHRAAFVLSCILGIVGCVFFVLGTMFAVLVTLVALYANRRAQNGECVKEYNTLSSSSS